jgi:hypothetical protein
MTRAATLSFAAIVFLCSAAAAITPPVMFDSPCECHDAHGKARLPVKNDPSTPPGSLIALQIIAALAVGASPEERRSTIFRVD